MKISDDDLLVEIEHALLDAVISVENIKNSKKTHNCYGLGFDEGSIAALKFVKKLIMEGI